MRTSWMTVAVLLLALSLGGCGYNTFQSNDEQIRSSWSNVVAFPFAAGVFYPLTISTEMAAITISGSSLLVAASALLLKRATIQWLR